MAAAICFRSAIALLGGFPVLSGVDLDVAEGEVVLLQGANGAGKTSLLRACAGLLAITSGRAEVLGFDLLSDRRAPRRQLALLGHDTALYDDLSVEHNVRFAVRASGLPTSRVAPALERLGLDGRLRSVPVSRVSAGQRRRTALAVMVARDPRLWLLDEPHAGLDAEHRDVLDEVVREAVARGATVVLASHERDRAAALAGRVVVMAGGRVVPAQPAEAELRPEGTGLTDPGLRPPSPADARGSGEPVGRDASAPALGGTSAPVEPVHVA